MKRCCNTLKDDDTEPHPEKVPNDEAKITFRCNTPDKNTIKKLVKKGRRKSQEAN